MKTFKIKMNWKNNKNHKKNIKYREKSNDYKKKN